VQYKSLFQRPSYEFGVFLLYAACIVLWLLWPSFFLHNPAATGAFLLLGSNFLVLRRSKTRFILPDLLPLLMLLTMWVAPGIQFYLESGGQSMSGQMMRVSSDTYFRICVPGVLAFGLGMYTSAFFSRKLAVFRLPALNAPLIPVLAAIGTAAAILGPFVPAGLRFPALLLQSLLWVAMLASIWSPDRRLKWMIVLPGLLVFFLQALYTTMFGELMAGGLILFVYVQYKKRWGLLPLLTAQVLGGLLLFFLISFKYTYRQAVQAQTGRLWDNFGIWQSLALDRLRHPLAVGGLDPVLSRINQGAISSICFDYVPRVQPFVRGETIRTAVAAALIPRILWPGKPTAGGVDHCRRFMGIENRGYSLNIGTVGEAYVNFGPQGAALFLFAWGLFLRLAFGGLWYLAARLPHLFFFFGVLFMPLLVPDSDVLMQLNHLVKGGVFSVLCCWGLERVLLERKER